jgi:hypothetical protein
MLYSVLSRETLKSQGPGLWVSLKVLQGDLASMQVRGALRTYSSGDLKIEK